MENNKPNKIVNECYREFKRLHKESGGLAANYDYEAEKILRQKLSDIHSVVGAVEVMSKPCLFKLIKMQCSLRFVAEHRFYRPFADVCELLYP